MTKKNKYENYTKEELIDELETLKKKRYGLVWDRKNSQELIDAFVNWENVPENFIPNKFPVLKEVKNKEISTDKDKPINLLIEGDNYHSLAVLNFTHKNKIDVIYIDPPYNTGNNDFIFNDNLVDKEDDFRHSKWLTFMEKRLKLAKSLLKNTGVIFISIDDNEIAQLKLLMDDPDLFGEKNRKTTIIWQKKVRPSNKNEDSFSSTTEYILMYSKTPRIVELVKDKLSEDYIKKVYRNMDNDPRGLWRTKPLWSESNPNPRKTLILPDGKKLTKKWFISQNKLNSLFKDNLIYISSGGVLNEKIFLKEERTKNPINFLSASLVGTTEEATKELKNLFATEKNIFSNPKPVRLIKYLLSKINNKSATALDFMAGSGTTGHAILELNKEDNGNRKFILCTNNENNICTDICYPRIEKVIKGYKNAKKEKIDGLGGNLKYLKTDFVGAQPTDKNKRGLVNNSAEMICIREDIFDLVAENNLDWKIYQKGKKYLGIVFNEEAIEDFKQAANKFKGQFIIYCFSYTETPPEKEFADLKNKHRLEPIPEIILKVYREIFKK